LIKRIQERIFPLIIALSALSVSGSAAFYSVSGLSKLFAGASLAVIIMASSLEIAKLVIASLLYQYRKTLPKLLKWYLTIAACVLVLITSAGIYGFLSAAYQKTASQSSIVDSQIKLLETKKSSFEKIKGQYDLEKESLTQNITSLRNALGNNTQSYVDNNGNVISYSSSANRKSFEKQLEVAIQKDEQLTAKVQTYNDSIISLETQIVEAQIGSEASSELGPLKYLSNLTGKPMDQIINILLLVIIFVFDPLAIALVIAANFAFAKLKKEPILDDMETVIEEEFDEDHALDMAMNAMVEDMDLEEFEEASLVDLQILEEEEKKTTEKYQDIVNSDLTEEEQKEAVEELIKNDHDTRLEISNQVLEDMTQRELTDEEALALYDTNKDGYLDDKEAKNSGLSKEQLERLRKKEAILKDPNIGQFTKTKLLRDL
jgi:hypothetical protein